ncbi:DNA polymerase Y family protein [Jatrophihabitans sp. YIM 134969]
MDVPRVAAVWCPDWPVTAAVAEAGIDPEAPAAVVVANRVVACSHAARRAGIRRGLRRREAQGRCPELAVLARAELAEVRAFEPIAQAMESIAPGVEVVRPGLATVTLTGPTRYFGGENAVLHALTTAIGASAGELASDVVIGAADGAFAAVQAARQGVLIEAGGSPAFLADLPVATIDPSGDSPLVDLLVRLGIRTLGAFAALPAADVLARFGPDGAWAHQQAGGRDDRPVAGRRPPTGFTVSVDLDPPVDRVDTVAFSVRGLGEQFVADLGAHGLACTCLEVTAITENGEESVRRWRHTGVLGSVEVLDRVRWQLEGWLSGGVNAGAVSSYGGHRRPTGGIVRVALAPVETVPTGTHQQSLWGGSGADDERAHRGLARVQTLLGHGSVLVPVVAGGRDPAARSELVPWGDEPTPSRSPAAPWPGSLPAPHPTVLLDPPRPVAVTDSAGRTITVTDRGAVAGIPAVLRSAADSWPITSWAGPWPVDERWWDPSSALSVSGLRARFQLVDVHGRAYLATHTRSGPDVTWTLDAVYD